MTNNKAKNLQVHGSGKTQQYEFYATFPSSYDTIDIVAASEDQAREIALTCIDSGFNKPDKLQLVSVSRVMSVSRACRLAYKRIKPLRSYDVYNDAWIYCNNGSKAELKSRRVLYALALLGVHDIAGIYEPGSVYTLVKEYRKPKNYIVKRAYLY